MRATLWAPALALVPALAGCSGILDADPEGSVTPSNFYRSAADAEAAVNGAYQPLVDNLNFKEGTLTVLDMASDAAFSDPAQALNGNQRALGRMTFDAGNTLLTVPWTPMYRIITRANAVVARVPEVNMDAARRASIVGEARFLRAWAYFNLVRLYGDVPLVTADSAAGQVRVPRAPVADVYAQIVADLDSAARVLPARWTGANVGRPTKWAARTALADVYLTRQQWPQAAAQAKAVIDSGAYTLAADYATLFTAAGNNGNESIFAAQISNDGVIGSSYVRFYYPSTRGVGQGGGFSIVIPTAWQYRNYDFSAPVRDTTWDYRHDVTYATTFLNNANRPTAIAPHVVKFKPTNTNLIDGGDVNIPLYRYAEVLLIYAEALNEQGQTAAALPFLNQVRTRARNAAGTARALPANYTAPLDQASVREAVFQERARELAHEGKRWFDLIRRGADYFVTQIKAHDPEAIDVTATDMLLPIPQGERQTNPELTQNPGY